MAYGQGLSWNPCKVSRNTLVAESCVGGATYLIMYLGNGHYIAQFDGTCVVDGGLEKCVTQCEKHDRELRILHDGVVESVK
jgi:hypothetical protein